MSCLIYRTKQPREPEWDKERTDIQIISWSLLKLTWLFMWMKAMIIGLWAPLLLFLLLTSLTSLSPVCIFSLSSKTTLCLHHSYTCHWQTKGLGKRLLILDLFLNICWEIVLSLCFPLKSTSFLLYPKKCLTQNLVSFFQKYLAGLMIDIASCKKNLPCLSLALYHRSKILLYLNQ